MPLDPAAAAFTMRQATAYVGLSKATLDRLVAAGRLPKRHCGRTAMFLRRDLDALLEALPVTPVRARRAPEHVA